MSRPAVFFAEVVFALLALCSLTSEAYAADSALVARLSPVFEITSYHDGRRLLAPQAIGVDPVGGDVYVADTNNGRIAVFDRAGHYITSFSHVSSPDRAAEPIGVAVGRTGQVYVTDSSSHHIQVYDLRGRPIRRIGAGAHDRDALFGRMTLDTEGNLYVTARNKGQAFIFSPDGTLKLKIGQGADQSSVIEMATDVAVDREGKVYILSSRGTAVHVFNAEGRAVMRFGEHQNGPGNFAFPTALDVDDLGRIWVVDGFANCIKIFKSDGSFVTSIGGYALPVDLAVQQRQLLVLEKGAQRLSGHDLNAGGAVN